MIMLMGRMCVYLVDINGAFLLGEFKLEVKIFMKIPHSFEKFLSTRCIVLFEAYSVQCEECCESILGTHEIR